jgi:hypothetical protein
MNSKQLRCLLYSLGIQGAVVLAMYLSVQPDPKGIGFFILTYSYAFLCGLISSFLIFTKNSTDWFIYYFVLVGDGIFFYYLFQFIMQVRKFANTDFNALHFIMLCGCTLFFVMIVKIHKEHFETKWEERK